MKEANSKRIIRLRHALHRCPELSMQEKETIQILMDFLGRNTRLEIHAREGWFYALKKGEKHEGQKPAAGPIAFRADMDALPIPETICPDYRSLHPGISHKCGHDGHCAALCGLALELSGRNTGRDVYLIFQPGEEIGAGALLCRELIREKGIQEIYAFHNLGGYPEGSLVCRRGLTQPASEGLRICLTGKTSHASAPEKGNNPAGVLAKIALSATGSTLAQEALLPNRSLPQPPSSNLLAQGMITITGIQLGNGDFGISPGEGEICMTLRAETEERMLALEHTITDRAAELAAGAGLQMEVSVHDYFPETRNHESCLERVLEAARRKGMPIISMPEIWRASEDFGYYLKECPGAMVYIGNGESWPALHTSAYDFNDRILEAAVDLFLALV